LWSEGLTNFDSRFTGDHGTHVVELLGRFDWFFLSDDFFKILHSQFFISENWASF